MTENMKKFLEVVSNNEELKQKLTNVPKEDVIALAKEVGFELTEADFVKNDELSDDELDAVVGGALKCVCPLAGGGGGTDYIDDKTFGCACVLYGQGGDGRAKDFNCACVMGGIGTDEKTKEQNNSCCGV